MADSKTAVIVVQGLGDVFPLQGTACAALIRGTDTYEDLRVGRAVTVQNGAKTKQVAAQVVGLKVGALIDLVPEFGAQNLIVYGKPYSNLMAVQSMTDASGEDVLDVTKLYTAVSLVLSGPAEDVAPVTETDGAAPGTQS